MFVVSSFKCSQVMIALEGCHRNSCRQGNGADVDMIRLINRTSFGAVLKWTKIIGSRHRNIVVEGSKFTFAYIIRILNH